MEPAANVLIVDDSRVFRAAIEEALANQPGMRVIGSVFSGTKAIEFLRRQTPDVITLDVEMPGMDGLQTLQAIQQVNRDLPPGREIGVIMVSAFTKRGTDVTIRALDGGAFDFVTKPSGASVEENLAQLRRDLLPRIRMFLSRRRKKGIGRPHASRERGEIPERDGSSSETASKGLPASAGASDSASSVSPGGSPILPRRVRVVLVGASTGGPKALSALLPPLVSRVPAPIAIVQHMPAEFTRSLAEHLGRLLPVPVREAEEGTILAANSVYLAPGGRHLLVAEGPRGQIMARLGDGPPESGCRPSASVLFRSAAAIVGREAVALVLTGMGDDGTAGLEPLHRAGTVVIAQDESSSVVWGMPGSAVAAGCVHRVLPLSAIPSFVESVVLPGSPR